MHSGHFGDQVLDQRNTSWSDNSHRPRPLRVRFPHQCLRLAMLTLQVSESICREMVRRV